MTDYYPEGGFYETRSRQGESVYEDAAQFDPPVVPVDDQRADDNTRAGATLSISDLTKPASYEVSTTVYGS